MDKERFHKYSIIIPCFNRVDEIQEMVKSLQNLRFDCAKFEVIIIDDGSTDSTIEFLKKYQEEANYTLTFYSQKNKGPGAARNYGMDKVIGDFIIFLDSDCTVPDSWLSEINTALINNSADAFGGPDTYRDDGSYVVSEKRTEGVDGNEVWLYTLVGGKHDWPGSWGNKDFFAAHEIWKFFSRFLKE